MQILWSVLQDNKENGIMASIERLGHQSHKILQAYWKRVRTSMAIQERHCQDKHWIQCMRLGRREFYN